MRARESVHATLPGGIAGTLAHPGTPLAPAVLMLHGFGASRDEVGGMFADTAEALAGRGIASLRIDFRGFGDSPGDAAGTTVDRLLEDASAAFDWLSQSAGVDAGRLGILGFSLGGATAILTAAARPAEVRSLATWSASGDLMADFTAFLGPDAFAMAARDGAVPLDLGWRTITLRRNFFDSLADRDIGAAAAAYPGPLLMIAGSADFSAVYPVRFTGAATERRREAWIVAGADHIFGALSPGRGAAGPVIARTADWFAGTL